MAWTRCLLRTSTFLCRPPTSRKTPKLSEGIQFSFSS